MLSGVSDDVSIGYRVVESTSHRDIWCDGANVEVSPLRIIDPDLQAVKYIPTAVRGATWTVSINDPFAR
jgi:hypothetical protein